MQEAVRDVRLEAGRGYKPARGQIGVAQQPEEVRLVR